MGGDYYEREVQVASSSQSYSDQAAKTLTQASLHKSNDPKRFFEDEHQLLSTHKNPIVFALDVSGSMGDWPKVLIFLFFLHETKKIHRLFMINSPCFMVKS